MGGPDICECTHQVLGAPQAVARMAGRALELSCTRGRVEDPGLPSLPFPWAAGATWSHSAGSTATSGGSRREPATQSGKKTASHPSRTRPEPSCPLKCQPQPGPVLASLSASNKRRPGPPALGALASGVPCEAARTHRARPHPWGPEQTTLLQTVTVSCPGHGCPCPRRVACFVSPCHGQPSDSFCCL